VPRSPPGSTHVKMVALRWRRHDPLAVVVAVALCAAPGARAAQPAAQRVVFDQLADRTLEGVLAFVPESTPPATGFTLYEVAGQVSRRLADGVARRLSCPAGPCWRCAAASSSSSRRARRGSCSTTCCRSWPSIPSGRYLAVVRPAGATGSAIDLFESPGEPRPAATRAGPGTNNAPLFAPDGSLIFVSTRTGLSSF